MRRKRYKNISRRKINCFLLFRHVSTTLSARQEEITREKKLIRKSTCPLRAEQDARRSVARCICRRYSSVFSTKKKSPLSRFKLFNEIFFTSSRSRLAAVFQRTCWDHRHGHFYRHSGGGSPTNLFFFCHSVGFTL